MMKKLLFVVSSLLVLQTALFACRYTVREIGFADFGADSYRFILFKDDRISASDAAMFKQIASAALPDANITAEIFDVTESDSLSVLKFYKKDENGNMPGAVLISPEKRGLPFYFSDENKSFAEKVWSLLEKIVTSPARDELTQNIVGSYGVVFFIEGKDAQQNEKAWRELNRAVQKIKLIMPGLPKPVDLPPKIIEIKMSEIEDEEVLLWSLGWNQFDKMNPFVAIIYGRGRRMGQIVKGNQITENLIENMLRYVGADCECGLDRSWMLGTMVPLRWPSKLQSQVIRQYGFDAENPMVVSEMSQILSVSPFQVNKAKKSENLYGYKEGLVEISDSGSVREKSGEEETDTVHSLFHINKVLILITGILIFILSAGGFIFVRARRRNV